MKKASGLVVALLLCLIFGDLVSSQQQLFTPKRVGPLRQQQQQQQPAWPQYTIVQNASFMPPPVQPTPPTLIQPVRTTQMVSSIIQNTQLSNGLVKECIEKNGLKSCLMEVFKDKTEVNQIDFKYILEAMTVVSERSLQYCYDVFTKKVCDMANELNGHHHKSPSQNQPWPRPPINIMMNTTRVPTLNESSQVKQNIQRPILQSVTTNNPVWQQQQQQQNQVPVQPVDQTVKYRDGSTYTGHMENGKRNGKGIYMFPSGEKYEGDWLNDEMSGNGSYHFSNGDFYQGEWVRGQRTGNGTYISKNGSKYVGGWVNGVKEGSGTHFFVNGDRLEGQFRSGQSNGMGTYFWKNGDSYKGEWVNGMKYGVGNYTYANGKTLKGRWDSANMFIRV